MKFYERIYVESFFTFILYVDEFASWFLETSKKLLNALMFYFFCLLHISISYLYAGVKLHSSINYKHFRNVPDCELMCQILWMAHICIMYLLFCYLEFLDYKLSFQYFLITILLKYMTLNKIFLTFLFISTKYLFRLMSTAQFVPYAWIT